jgi:hypothetical protein
MTIFYVLMGALLCSITITIMQIKLAQRKEMNELNELFEKIKIED